VGGDSSGESVSGVESLADVRTAEIHSQVVVDVFVVDVDRVSAE
jgi:hypothetical protein